MRKNTPTINQVIKNPELLNYDNCWSFYDWFCDDRSLERRAKAMLPKLKFLVKEGIIDGDTHYVWFKNNCPFIGSLYDDLRINTLDDKDQYVLYVCPKCGHDSSVEKCTVSILTPSATSSLPNMDDNKYLNWSTFKRELKSNSELKEKIVKGISISEKLGLI